MHVEHNKLRRFLGYLIPSRPSDFLELRNGPMANDRLDVKFAYELLCAELSEDFQRDVGFVRGAEERLRPGLLNPKKCTVNENLRRARTHSEGG